MLLGSVYKGSTSRRCIEFVEGLHPLLCKDWSTHCIHICILRAAQKTLLELLQLTNHCHTHIYI